MTMACHSCGSPVPETVRFCEGCGADLEEPPEARWELVVRSDREYFQRVDAEGVDFPGTDVEWAFRLTGDRVTVGRARSGSEPVDLDLSGPPADAGVSHLHASFTRQPDGAWAIADSGSTNGTFLNDQETPIPPGDIVFLADGDRIHLGAWTSITLRRVR